MAPLKPPVRHPDLVPEDGSVYIVTNPKTAAQRSFVLPCPCALADSRTGQGQVLHRRGDEVYVHFLKTDRRLDEWVPTTHLRVAEPHEITEPVEIRGKKRKRVPSHRAGSPSAQQNGAVARARSASPEESEADSDTGEHLRLTAKRNFDRVNFGHWQIKTWYAWPHPPRAVRACDSRPRRYFSPYPVSEAEQEQGAVHISSDPFAAARAAEKQQRMVPRSTLRAHGRTADLVAGGLGRELAPPGYTTLWVCDRCFKYMREGVQWELHIVGFFVRLLVSFSCRLVQKNCKWSHPPGRKVYQRGAHIIWEVDGALEKVGLAISAWATF